MQQLVELCLNSVGDFIAAVIRLCSRGYIPYILLGVLILVVVIAVHRKMARIETAKPEAVA